jgi:hypothetical protein
LKHFLKEMESFVKGKYKVLPADESKQQTIDDEVGPNENYAPKNNKNDSKEEPNEVVVVTTIDKDPNANDASTPTKTPKTPFVSNFKSKLKPRVCYVKFICRES